MALGTFLAGPIGAGFCDCSLTPFARVGQLGKILHPQGQVCKTQCLCSSL